MSYVEYSSNNSGGHWWLNDDQWRALEKAGWKVKWAYLDFKYDKKGNYVRDKDGTPKFTNLKQQKLVEIDKNGDTRWLGALATNAFRPGAGIKQAVAEWELVTGLSSTEPGCPCCGKPHYFTEVDDAGRHVASGPNLSYTASWD